ncbi:hypothetical protein PSY52_23135, partial [Shigella flexneri]|nr:hypothetical protein [Shigella flexneri]
LQTKKPPLPTVVFLFAGSRLRAAKKDLKIFLRSFFAARNLLPAKKDLKKILNHSIKQNFHRVIQDLLEILFCGA